MRIFVATNNLPKPDTAAGDRRFFAILEMMCRKHEVTLLALNPSVRSAQDESYFQRLEKIGVRRIILGRGSMRRSMATCRFDLGFFEFFHAADELAPEFRLAQPGVPTVVDSVDIHFLREAAALKLGKMTAEEAAENKRRELSVYQDASGVIVITPEDEHALRRELAGIKTWLIPIIVPLVARPHRVQNPTLLFVGGFKHAPNVDGILWFANEILPRVKVNIPAAELLVVGSDAPEEVKALDGCGGVKVIGYVPDTIPYLQQAAVSVAPLRFGAGMKGKVSEALAAGVPVVTTSFGAQGFCARHGEHMLVADDAEKFARHVVDLLHDPANANVMAERGKNLVKQICSPEAVAMNVQQMLEEVKRICREKNAPWKRTLFCSRYWGGAPFRVGRRTVQRLINTL